MAPNDDFFRKQWLSEVPPFVPLFFDWKIRPDVDHYRRCYKDQLCPTLQQQLHEQQTKEAMTKFKKGDRVKCMNPNSVDYTKTGTCTTDGDKCNWVWIDGRIGETLYEAKYLTLVDQPLSTTPDKVLQAAKTSPQAKDALKALFPDVFKESGQPFDFGWTYAIPCSNPNHPLSIGIAGVPFSPLEGRCLVMDNSLWEMKTQAYCGRTILTFHKKP